MEKKSEREKNEGGLGRGTALPFIPHLSPPLLFLSLALFRSFPTTESLELAKATSSDAEGAINYQRLTASVYIACAYAPLKNRES